MIKIMSTKLLDLISKLPGKELVLAPKEAVFLQGDSVQSMHIIRRGAVTLTRYNADGSACVMQRARSGDVVAEASAYSLHYHCDAHAVAPTVAWTVSRPEFRARLADDRQFAESWSRHLAHEVQRARLHAEILSLKKVGDRLSAWLAWHGCLPEKGQYLSVAAEIGVTPEALYRELAKRRG